MLFFVCVLPRLFLVVLPMQGFRPRREAAQERFGKEPRNHQRKDGTDQVAGRATGRFQQSKGG